MHKKASARKGVTLIEASLVLIVSILITIMATMAWTEVSFRLDRTKLINQVAEISAGAVAWKGFRSNYTGISMTVLCAEGQQSVSESTCGGVDGSGTSSNAFGGNFVLSAATNVSQTSLQITGLPTERINELADGLAPNSANQCASATGCATVAISSNTVTLTL